MFIPNILCIFARRNDNTDMCEELKQNFENIVATYANTDKKRVALVKNNEIPEEYDFGIKYSRHKEHHLLVFKFVDSDHLLSREKCAPLIDACCLLPSTTHVCLITDIGFAPSVVDYIREKNLFGKDKVFLAKFCNQIEVQHGLHRQLGDYFDPQQLYGVLTSEEPCKGVVMLRDNSCMNPVGLLAELEIPIHDEQRFRCEYISNEDIENRVNEVLKNNNITREDIYNTTSLEKIVAAEHLTLLYEDCAGRWLGEYEYQNAQIKIAHKNDPAHRDRFTLAHELGHHFLHRYRMEQYKFNLPDNNASINIIGSANTDIRRFEFQANTFASYLLMPAEYVSEVSQRILPQMTINKGFVYADNQYIASLHKTNQQVADDFVEKIANKFKVSKQVAKIRLKNLNIYREDEHKPRQIGRLL